MKTTPLLVITSITEYVLDESTRRVMGLPIPDQYTVKTYGFHTTSKEWFRLELMRASYTNRWVTTWAPVKEKYIPNSYKARALLLS